MNVTRQPMSTMPIESLATVKSAGLRQLSSPALTELILSVLTSPELYNRRSFKSWVSSVCGCEFGSPNRIPKKPERKKAANNSL